MVKTVARGPRNLETYSGYAQPHANVFFYQLRFKNDSFISERDLAM